jgi:hypothetical protein
MAKPVHGISESKSLFGAPCLAHRLGRFTVNAAKGDESVSARRVQPVSKCQPCKQRAVRSLARTTSTSLSCLAVSLSAKRRSNRVFTRSALSFRRRSSLSIPQSHVINTTRDEAPNTLESHQTMTQYGKFHVRSPQSIMSKILESNMSSTGLLSRHRQLAINTASV